MGQDQWNWNWLSLSFGIVRTTMCTLNIFRDSIKKSNALSDEVIGEAL